MEEFCNYKELIIDNRFYWIHRVQNEGEGGYENISTIVERVLTEFNDNN